MKINNFLLLILIFTFSLKPVNIFSNENDKNTQEYNYTVRTFLRIPTLHTTIDGKDDEYSLDYAPNVKLQIGAGGSIYDFGGSLSFNITMNEEQLNKYGKSEYFDFQLYYINEHFGIDFYLQTYKGFYLEGEDEITIRDDIELAKISMNFFYAYNKEFSLKAGIDQSKKQKTSELSWFFLSGIELFALYSPNNIIPDKYNNNNDFFFQEVVFIAFLLPRVMVILLIMMAGFLLVYSFLVLGLNIE